ncbi:hypothetical protein IF1G_06506 [Cordyceps javanica]|uniref:Uncharacterized protein n=1 Tax=Cordyceps javanica TaxID=43265 RepID=A0A545UYD4_9HYPO|nr:hypothetical protein IF1G_06506 [Cordyceps javanica]
MMERDVIASTMSELGTCSLFVRLASQSKGYTGCRERVGANNCSNKQPLVLCCMVGRAAVLSFLGCETQRARFNKAKVAKLLSERNRSSAASHHHSHQGSWRGRDCSFSGKCHSQN